MVLPYPRLLDEYLPHLIKNGGKKVVLRTQFGLEYLLHLEDVGMPKSVEMSLEDDITMWRDPNKGYELRDGFEVINVHAKVLKREKKEKKILFEKDHFKTHGVCIASEWVDLDKGCSKGSCDSVKVTAQGALVRISHLGPSGEEYANKIFFYYNEHDIKNTLYEFFRGSNIEEIVKKIIFPFLGVFIIVKFNYFEKKNLID